MNFIAHSGQAKPVTFRLLLVLCFWCLLFGSAAARGNEGVSVSLSPSGRYTVTGGALHLSFSGMLPAKPTAVVSSTGKDAIGSYKSISFRWKGNNKYAGDIRWYNSKPVVIFSLTLPEGAAGNAPAAFPDFDGIPKSLHHFSYHNDVFSKPQFSLEQTSTPWLLFDNDYDACVISPASDFIVSMLSGDGQTQISSALNAGVKNLPRGFTHRTIMVFDKGISKVWDSWGSAMRTLYSRTRPANDADDVLKYFGYWTDNGADYYYNYDTSLGYENTLLALRKRYREENIPLGYMQLDSWWYEKSIYDPDGKPDADHKNKNLPEGAWNRYGGLMDYKADPFLFPDGLSGFHQKLGLPMVTHNRWIDPKSPYHQQYKISGYAATDPKFWADIMTYLHQAGVICYEQDWLNYIYEKSPGMVNDIHVGNAFTDGMAHAAQAHGLDVQYCMAMPRYFLQGVKYNNLTTIRTSDDRFEPVKWMPFIFTSQLGYEMGIWPWCDVFKSGETGNMIISVLSAGPVGTGDAIGKEDKANIMMACRQDGVLVKPDAPLLPLDHDYMQMSMNEGKPVLAFTCTQHAGIKTGYLFAFADQKTTQTGFSFQPSALGFTGSVVVFNPADKKYEVVPAGKSFSANVPPAKYVYYIIAPVTRPGVAFLGDENKIAATGKKRIAAIKTTVSGLSVEVLFAKGEKEVTLQGYCKHPISADKGKVTADATTHLFTLAVKAPVKGDSVWVGLR